MARKSDIRLRRSNVANAVPGGADLNEGELAINTMDGALYFKKSDGTIITGHDNTIMHIDSANSRVGIGTSSPGAKLSVSGGIIRVQNGSNATYYEEDKIHSYASSGLTIDGREGLTLETSTADTDIILNPTGYVGIGTSSPARKLDVNAGSASMVAQFKSTLTSSFVCFANSSSTADQVRLGSNGTALTFSTNYAERMRIDSSGNLLVSTTNTAPATNNVAGISLRNEGHINVSRASGVVGYFNRITNDGEIIRFNKDGSIVGSIGTVSSGDLYIADGRNAGIKLDGGNNQVIPVNSAGAQLDNTLDLGKSDTRFKDLHLSGTVNVGSTTSLYEGAGGDAFFKNTNAGADLFLDSSRRIRFTANGSERMRIDASGKVGIGTNSPLDLLHIVSTSTDARQVIDGHTGYDAELKFAENGTVKYTIGHDAASDNFVIGTTNVDTQQRLVINSAGNVGIGTTSPDGELHVLGSGGGNGDIYVERTSGAKIHLQAQSANGKIGTFSNHNLGFNTNATTRMTITNTGNVGIGTSTPSRKLEVDFTASTVGARFTRSDTTGSSTIEFANSAGVKSVIGFNAGTSNFDIQNGGAVRLAVSNAGAITFNEAFTFPTSIGNAGQLLKVPSTGTTLVWADDAGGGSATVLTDTDGDTKIQVEESADEDIIRFDIAGTQKMFLDSGELNLDGDLAVSGNLNITGDINSTSVTNLDVTDKTITMANNSGSSTAADGAGIIIEGPSNNASLLWDHTNQYLEFSKEVFSPAGFVIGTTGTKVGKMYNSSGVMALEAYTNRQISFGNATNGEHVRIDATGNVGIGTTAPSSILDVAGSAAVLTITDTRDQSFTVGDTMCSLAFDSNDASGGAGTASHPRALISLVAETTFGSSTGLSFSTKQDTTTAPTEMMRISTAGNVGIGTSTPSKPLHVQFSGDHGARIESENNHASLYIDSHTAYGQYIRFTENNTDKYWINSTSGKLVFRPAATGTVTNQVIFDASGNVGIGTASPASGIKLHVQGWARLVGGLQLSATNAQVTNIANSNLLFGTNNTEKMRITADGNVGIGTTSPAGKLMVREDSAGNPTRLIVSNGGTVQSGTSVRLSFYEGTSEKSYIERRRDGSGETAFVTPADDNPFVFESSGSLGEFARFDEGKLGIGTSSPDTKLDVTSSGVNGILLNQDTASAATSSRLMFKDNVRTNLLINVNGILQFRTDAAVNSSSGTTRLSVSPTLVKSEVPLRVEEYQIDTTVTSTSATTQVAINTFAAATFRSARFTIQITNTTDSTYHSTEILAIHDGTTANITEFGEVHTGSSVEATFDADISSGNFRLLATPTSTNSMAFKVVCHSLTV